MIISLVKISWELFLSTSYKWSFQYFYVTFLNKFNKKDSIYVPINESIFAAACLSPGEQLAYVVSYPIIDPGLIHCNESMQKRVMSNSVMFLRIVPEALKNPHPLGYLITLTENATSISNKAWSNRFVGLNIKVFTWEVKRQYICNCLNFWASNAKTILKACTFIFNHSSPLTNIDTEGVESPNTCSIKKWTFHYR